MTEQEAIEIAEINFRVIADVETGRLFKLVPGRDIVLETGSDFQELARKRSIYARQIAEWLTEKG